LYYVSGGYPPQREAVIPFIPLLRRAFNAPSSGIDGLYPVVRSFSSSIASSRSVCAQPQSIISSACLHSGGLRSVACFQPASACIDPGAVNGHAGAVLFYQIVNNRPVVTHHLYSGIPRGMGPHGSLTHVAIECAHGLYYVPTSERIRQTHLFGTCLCVSARANAFFPLPARPRSEGYLHAAPQLGSVSESAPSVASVSPRSPFSRNRLLLARRSTAVGADTYAQLAGRRSSSTSSQAGISLSRASSGTLG